MYRKILIRSFLLTFLLATVVNILFQSGFSVSRIMSADVNLPNVLVLALVVSLGLNGFFAVLYGKAYRFMENGEEHLSTLASRRKVISLKSVRFPELKNIVVEAGLIVSYADEEIGLIKFREKNGFFRYGNFVSLKVDKETSIGEMTFYATNDLLLNKFGKFIDKTLPFFETTEKS